MKILVIDAHGGGAGKQLVIALKAAIPDAMVVAVGTNSAASQAMLKAGADKAATGENAVIVNCRNANLIIGPLGIVIADSMMGEITPAMAVAVAQSQAKRILLPFNLCDNVVVGVNDFSLGKLISAAVEEASKQ